jgi:adenylate cyclase
MTAAWSRLRDIGRKHLAGILAAVAVVALVQWGLLDNLEYWALDQLFEWRGEREPRLPIVIVAIDDSSIVELNEQWPFPRAMHGELLRKIARGKPLAIGVDLMFDTPSARGAADDAALGAAVADAGNVILGPRSRPTSHPSTFAPR